LNGLITIKNIPVCIFTFMRLNLSSALLMRKSFFFLLFLLPALVHAQYKITGRVVDSASKKPVPGATVFLADALVIAATTVDGRFTLENVRNGQYGLVVSAVGFGKYKQSVNVHDNVELGDISISLRAVQLHEVRIVRGKNFNKKYYKMFAARFLGATENAKSCSILNPHVLNIRYDDDKDVLTAASDDFLEIQNKALGYKLKYLLENFISDEESQSLYYDGVAAFEQMDGNASRQKKWDLNRVKAYKGSMMHFLRSLIANQMTEEGFTAYKLLRSTISDPAADSIARERIKQYKLLIAQGLPEQQMLAYWRQVSHQTTTLHKLIEKPLKLSNILKKTDQKGIFALTYPFALYIIYNKDNVYRESVITFKTDYTLFDLNGHILNPESVFIEGSWSNNRIADSLPIDYELPQN